MTTPKTSWHTRAIVYQIYPRSFQDSDNDGVGDLQGIIDRLDYLNGSTNSLGINVIWLSPVYTSPMADFGYDVADYVDIDPLFGSLKLFRILVKEAHKRQIKIILDFVPNHTSDQHPWFKESSASRVNSKRDWYIWKNGGSSGTEPNNWQSNFGGPAWTYSPQTDQYYLHSFLAAQPDLNWDNPEVRGAMKTVMRFWLDIGVDGFRVDAVDWLSKDPEFRNNVISKPAKFNRDGPHLFERLNEMTDVLLEYEDRFMITEAHPETENKIQGYLNYYEAVNSQLSAPFNFESIYVPWQASRYREFVDSFQAGMKASFTPIYTLGNHDESRVATRIGSEAARTAAMLLLTLPGLPIIYYGDEIGMHDVKIPPDQARDPFVGPGNNRDAQRTPMQWDGGRYAGFSRHTPWLPVASDFASENVTSQMANQRSMLKLYKDLIALRGHSEALSSGSYRSADFGPDIFGYYRQMGGNSLLILLNFAGIPRQVSQTVADFQLKLSTNPNSPATAVQGKLTLGAHEGVIMEQHLD